MQEFQQLLWNTFVTNWIPATIIPLGTVGGLFWLFRHNTKERREEERQAKTIEVTRLATLDAEYRYRLPGYGPAKFMGIKTNPVLGDPKNQRLYLYHLKTGGEAWVNTSPEKLEKYGS